MTENQFNEVCYKAFEFNKAGTCTNNMYTIISFIQRQTAFNSIPIEKLTSLPFFALLKFQI